MKKAPLIISIGIISVLLGLTGCGESHPTKLVAGGNPIEVPFPDGYVRVDGVNSSFDRLIKSKQAGTNQLLAFYGTEKDLTALKKGEATAVPRNFNLQVINPHLDCSLDDFAVLIKGLEDEMATGMKSAKEMFEKTAEGTNEVLSELSDDKVTLSLGQPVPLGIMEKSKTWVTFAMKIPMDTQEGTRKKRSVSTTVNSIVLVNSKAIGLYGTHVDGGDGSLEKLKEEVDAWREAVIKANAEK